MTDDGATFVVWSPLARRAAVETEDRIVALFHGAEGYHAGTVDGVRAGDTYWLRLDGQRRPDPASRSQPEGIDGPSAVVDTRFAWTDEGFSAPPLAGWTTPHVPMLFMGQQYGRDHRGIEGRPERWSASSRCSSERRQT